MTTTAALEGAPPLPNEAQDFFYAVGALLCDACGVLSCVRKDGPGGTFTVADRCQVCADNLAYATGALEGATSFDGPALVLGVAGAQADRLDL